MPQVTEITPQKKQKRFNVFVDGKFAFGIGEYGLLANRIKVGQTLTEEQIKKIVSQDKFLKLFDLVSKFLAVRPRTEKEIRDYLSKKIAQKEAINFSQASQSPALESIILKLKKYNYINDVEFAKWFISSRLKTRPKSISFIKMELSKKGIKREHYEDLFQNSQDETQIAKKAIEKKIKRWENLPPVDFKKKFFNYLLTRGFSYETIAQTFAFFTKKS